MWADLRWWPSQPSWTSVLWLVAALALAAGPAPAESRQTLRKFLEGHWQGDGLDLRIDQDAVQANRDPQKPFAWEPLRILDVAGSMVVFDIGSDRYVALIGADSMTISMAGSPGSRVVTRQPER